MIEFLQKRSLEEIKKLLESFSKKYAWDWKEWIWTLENYTFVSSEVAKKFGEILRKWQAGRPRTISSDETLLTVLDKTSKILSQTPEFNLRDITSSNTQIKDVLKSLWNIFKKDLTIEQNTTNVGVTKAIMLLTRGKIGPAFDSNASRNLNYYISSFDEYYRGIQEIADDISKFEYKENVHLEDLVPDKWKPLNIGRAYDMLIGPKDKVS
jgi:hypothetical protein